MILKKVRYVPGLISLIGLPILLLLFGPDDQLEHNVIIHVIPTDDLDTSSKFNTTGNVNRMIGDKKVISVALWDNSHGSFKDEAMENIYLNNEKLKFIEEEMRRLQFTNDSLTVLKVELGNRNSYGEFVWLINKALVYRFKRYSLVDDNLYFFGNDPAILYSKFALDPITIDPASLIMPGYTPPTKWEIFVRDFQYELEEIAYMLRRNLLLVIGFLILIIIPAVVHLLMRKPKAGIINI